MSHCNIILKHNDDFYENRFVQHYYFIETAYSLISNYNNKEIIQALFDLNCDFLSISISKPLAKTYLKNPETFNYIYSDINKLIAFNKFFISQSPLISQNFINISTVNNYCLSNIKFLFDKEKEQWFVSVENSEFYLLNPIIKLNKLIHKSVDYFHRIENLHKNNPTSLKIEIYKIRIENISQNINLILKPMTHEHQTISLYFTQGGNPGFDYLQLIPFIKNYETRKLEKKLSNKLKQKNNINNKLQKI